MQKSKTLSFEISGAWGYTCLFINCFTPNQISLAVFKPGYIINSGMGFLMPIEFATFF